MGLVGGWLLVRGVRRRSLPGTVTAFAGGWLTLRALGGQRRLERILDVPTHRDRAGGMEPPESPTISRSITIGRPADELYEAWRDHDRLSEVVGHFAEVTSLDGGRLRWRVRGPRGYELSWETRFVEETPGEHLRWETTGNAVVPKEGSVRFRPAPGERGTEVTLSVAFDPPGGVLGDLTLGKLDVVPTRLADVTLRRFKSHVETGEIPTLEGNPSARGVGDRI